MPQSSGSLNKLTRRFAISLASILKGWAARLESTLASDIQKLEGLSRVDSEANSQSNSQPNSQPHPGISSGLDLPHKRNEFEPNQAETSGLLERVRYEEVLNQSSIPMILMLGPKHEVAFTNPAYRSRFVAGVDPKGKLIAEVLPETMAQGFGEWLDRVYETGEPFVGRDIHFEWKDESGQLQETYLDFTYAAKRNAFNEIEGVLAVIVDVGDKVRARFEAEASMSDLKTRTAQLQQAKLDLEDEQQKFKTIFAASSTSMALLKGRDFVYEIANSSYNQLFSNRELIGRPLLVALPELMGQKFPEMMNEAFKTGVPYIEREAQAYLRRTTNGPLEERYFDQSYSRVDDVNGAPYGFYIHARDVSDLVFARRALEQSNERLRIALEIAEMGTWSLDVEKGWVEWSPRCEEFFEYPGVSELPVESVLEKIDKEDVDRVRQSIERAMDPNGDGEYSVEYRVKHRNGDAIWCSVLGKMHFVETATGRAPKKFIGVMIDITERMNIAEQLRVSKERAERASAAKSQFLANMSHEIRTPLGAIMGFASLLRDPAVGSDQYDGFVAVIERNSTQLLRIIDDILDLSKVEAGMMLIEQIEFSLPETLTDFSSLMGFKAREKGIGFSSTAATALPKIIRTDPTRLRQILMNVVGNAIKFTDVGGVELRTSYFNGLLQFDVVDTGRGISKDQEQHLFQPFSQADASTTRKYGGTGLGLVLTRSLSEALGGSFVLHASELEKGSHFRIQIAVEIQPGADFVTGLGFETVPVRSVQGAGQLSGMKILLVEDSPDNQALLSIFLGRAGARIDIASDGLQGYTRAMSGEYDMVLMDVQMPVLDGISAIKRMRAEGFTKTVIALTAHAMKEERIRCLDAGFTDFLSKPVTRQELVDKILRYRTKP